MDAQRQERQRRRMRGNAAIGAACERWLSIRAAMPQQTRQCRNMHGRAAVPQQTRQGRNMHGRAAMPRDTIERQSRSMQRADAKHFSRTHASPHQQQQFRLRAAVQTKDF